MLKSTNSEEFFDDSVTDLQKLQEEFFNDDNNEDESENPNEDHNENKDDDNKQKPVKTNDLLPPVPLIPFESQDTPKTKGVQQQSHSSGEFTAGKQTPLHEEKVYLLMCLNQLSQKGVQPSREFSLKDNLEDIKNEYELQKNKFLSELDFQKQQREHLVHQKLNRYLIKSINGFNFYNDIYNRPYIIVKPVKQVYDITDLNDFSIFKAIKEFCETFFIYDYQVSYSNGTWKSLDHFYIKIKVHEQIAEKIRRSV